MTSQTFKPSETFKIKYSFNKRLPLAILLYILPLKIYNAVFPQESIESYVEDEANDISNDYTKAITSESPSSVIHVTVEDDQPNLLRRGSSQATVVDPFHPAVGQRNSLDSFSNQSRKPSVVDPFRPPSPTRRPSGGDPYQLTAATLKPSEEPYVPLSRRASIDPYQQTTSRRASIRYPSSPLQQPANREDKEEESEVKDGGEEVANAVTVSLEEEEAQTVRTKVTAQQRWLWAYNKIIIQLNVSF